MNCGDKQGMRRSYQYNSKLGIFYAGYLPKKA